MSSGFSIVFEYIQQRKISIFFYSFVLGTHDKFAQQTKKHLNSSALLILIILILLLLRSSSFWFSTFFNLYIESYKVISKEVGLSTCLEWLLLDALFTTVPSKIFYHPFMSLFFLIIYLLLTFLSFTTNKNHYQILFASVSRKTVGLILAWIMPFSFGSTYELEI